MVTAIHLWLLLQSQSEAVVNIAMSISLMPPILLNLYDCCYINACMCTTTPTTASKQGDGCVTLEDLQGRYDPSWHPEVKNGTKRADQVMRAFLRQWDCDADGTVTFEEFMA